MFCGHKDMGSFFIQQKICIRFTVRQALPTCLVNGTECIHCSPLLGSVASTSMIHNRAPFPKVYKQDWGQKEDQEDRFAVDGTHHVFSMMHIYILSCFNASSEPRPIIKHQVFNGTQSPFSEALNQSLSPTHSSSSPDLPGAGLLPTPLPRFLARLLHSSVPNLACFGCSFKTIAKRDTKGAPTHPEEKKGYGGRTVGRGGVTGGGQ